MTRKPISKSLRFAVLNRDGFRCRYCGAGPEGVTLHIDHAVPVALGGTNDFDNLVTACIDCNLGKRTTVVELERDVDLDGIDCPFADGWPNEIHDPVFYFNGEWAITAYGLEAARTFYAIPWTDLDVGLPEDRSISMWLNHMPEKTWVFRNADAFLAAFLKALRLFHARIDIDLAASVARYREIAQRSRISDEAYRSPGPFDRDLIWEAGH